MTQWSVPISAGWKLRVTTGTSIGNEFPLALGRHVLGSQSPSTIVVPDPSIAPQHVVLEVSADHVNLTDQSGRGVSVNGQSQQQARVGPGDDVMVGTFGFQLVNPAVTNVQPSAGNPNWFAAQYDRCSQWLHGIDSHWRVAVISGVIASSLFALLSITQNPYLVPITLIAMSAVVPASVITFLVSRYDKTGISFRTLALTFLFGGALGIVATIVTGEVASLIVGGLIYIPIFAGVLEEPAKLLATFWRWRHPACDRPMDGLIIGTVSGFGFAVFETAGYSFNALIEDGMGDLIHVTIIRGVASPFGHGLWTGIVTAAFWQSGRHLPKAVKDRQFLSSLGIVVCLHALWNLAGTVPGVGLIPVAASAYLTFRLYRTRLANNGYAK